jgi:hypothetical protein
MGSLPKLLIALSLLLPGGFVVVPLAVVVMKRWRERRASQVLQLSASSGEPRPIAHSQAPA